MIAWEDDLSSLVIEGCCGTVFALGSGGMDTEFNAAQIVTDAGINMVIMIGKQPELLYDLLDDRSVGTLFVGRKV